MTPQDKKSQPDMEMPSQQQFVQDKRVQQGRGSVESHPDKSIHLGICKMFH